MKSVTIEYTRYFVFNRSKTIQVAEEWKDLNEKQFSTCARMYIEPLDEIDFIANFFGLKRRLVKRINKFARYKLTELANFAMMPKGAVNFFFVEKIPGTNLLAPQSRLANVSFEHFSLFDTFFFDYANKPTDENLCKMVAAMYLRKGDKITQIDFEKHQAYIAKHVDKSTQYAIFLNYVFIREWLSKAFPFLFEKSDEDEDEKPKAKRKLPRKKTSNRPNWSEILDSLVDKDFLNYDRYKNMPCTLGFKIINKRIKEFNRNGK